MKLITKFRRNTKSHLKKFRFVYGTIAIVFLIWFLFFALPRPLFQTPTSTILLSDDGQLLGATIATDGQWRFPENDSVPNKFETCIVQFEDAYFNYHPGVNPVSLFRALRQNVSSGKIESGGSTLSMQTIRLAKQNPKRTYLEKLVEIIQAVRLELGYSKNEILLKYASHAPFGGNVVGLDAASWRYFGKLSHHLSWGESATLAVLPNAPSLIYPGKNQETLKQKRNRLLQKLLTENIISQEDYELAILEPLPQKPNPLPQKAYHLLQTASKKQKGERINSSIDLDLQDQLNALVLRHHQNLSAQEIHNLAIVVVEVETGEIKGYIGNSEEDDDAHGNRVDIVHAARSSGSILKPFLYEKMLHDGELLPKMLLNDTPSDITENYDEQYDGAVAADVALARSLNIPAIDMLKRYGVEKFYHQLKKLDFGTLEKPSIHYGLSLIVGGGEVTLWDLAQAYRNMAFQLNHPKENTWRQMIHFTENEENKERKSPFQVQSTFLTIKALQQVARPDAEAGWRMFGNQQIAWKTGTSHGFKDAWAVGMTPEYVVAVWTGNADGEGRPGIIGVKAAAPILFDVFNRLPIRRKFQEPSVDWIAVKTCKISGYKAGRYCDETMQIKVPALAKNMEACPYHKQIHLDETATYRVNSDCYSVGEMKDKNWFVLPPIQEWYYQRKNPWYRKLPAFHPQCEEQNSVPFALIYPKNFTRIFLPVDLQGKKQSVVFELAHRQANEKVFWYLDGNYMGTTQHKHQMPLQPDKGKHLLVLSDENGNRLTKRFTIVE